MGDCLPVCRQAGSHPVCRQAGNHQTTMTQKISALILRLWGWKIEGDYPHHLSRVVIVPVPHTSNWDFPVGILLRSAAGADVKFVAKASLFRPPFGWLFRAMNGVPVERGRRSRFVESMVQVYKREKNFHTCIAPEGTRGKVAKLKSGFHFIAKGAGAHILPVAFDWGTMTLRWGEPFLPGEKKEDDVARLEAFFKGVKGKIPENGYMFEG